MKKYLCATYLIAILQSTVFAQVQETDLLSQAIESYNLQNFDEAYKTIVTYEHNSTWTASIGYWKIKTLDKIQNYQDINNPYFIALNQEINTLFNDAAKSPKDKRPLYDEYYQEIIGISNKVDFCILKLRWSNDKIMQDAYAEYERKNYGVAKLNAEKAIKTNNGLAYQMLGQIYENGLGVQQNYDVAYENYIKAFKAGNINAAYYIGYCIYYGLGVTKNINLGFDWCHLAAEYNYKPAMKEISVMYKKGIGTPKNTDVGELWWKRSNQ